MERPLNRKELENVEKNISKLEKKFYKARNHFNKYPKNEDPTPLVEVAQAVIDEYVKLTEMHKKIVSELEARIQGPK